MIDAQIWYKTFPKTTNSKFGNQNLDKSIEHDKLLRQINKTSCKHIFGVGVRN